MNYYRKEKTKIRYFKIERSLKMNIVPFIEIKNIFIYIIYIILKKTLGAMGPLCLY